MKVKERKFTPEHLKWKLEDMVESDAAWEEMYAEAKTRLPELSSFKGKLKDKAQYLACARLQSELDLKLQTLYIYANMRRDEDSSVSLYQGMADRATALVVQAMTAASFVQPELTEMPAETLIEWSKLPEFENYSYILSEIARSKEHILSEKEERLLSGVASFADNFKEIFTMFNDVDVKFDKVEDDNGNKLDMSHGLYGVLLQSRSEKVRRGAFESMYAAYKSHINTIAQTYAGCVKKDCFYAGARGFKSALEASMFGENIPTAVYENLLESVRKNCSAVHRYVALRKKILGFETLNMYDLYLPIVENAEIKLSYEKAYKLVESALKPMGKEYLEVFNKAYNEGWIDVVENKNKRSGAYSWGVYGCHPFVLLNYQKTTSEVFAIAHEMGHAIHTYYSCGNQPFEKSEYVIFLAEIASTVNEILLLKHLMKDAKGEFKKYLLSYYLDMFRTTLFRQTMFAEFEYLAHEMSEKGEPLTAEAFSNLYYKLNKQYYGKAVKHNEQIRYEWARIPHFYRSFYVYKYSTGIIAAVTIASDIIKRGEAAFAGYKKFLSAGNSTGPIEILKYAGVDLTDKKPFETAMAEFKATLKELESLA
jgi:oligoendopeptidase F